MSIRKFNYKIFIDGNNIIKIIFMIIFLIKVEEKNIIFISLKNIVQYILMMFICVKNATLKRDMINELPSS